MRSDNQERAPTETSNNYSYQEHQTFFFFGQESIKLKTVKLTRSNEYFVCTDP